MKTVGHTSEFLLGIYWTLKNPENQNFEKMKKNCWRYHHFTHVYQKPRSYELQLLRYGMRHFFFFLQQESNRDCHFRPFFALLPHYWPRKLKFGKNVNNTWRYYPFTHLHHKSRSHDVWFQRYKVQRTEFLSFWATFCPLTLLTTKKIKILER